MTATRRYGGPGIGLEVSNEVIERQLAHRSVRAFLDADVGDDVLTTLVASAQSASTSSNLQAWSVVSVRDRARKARLAHLAGDQGFIERAPVFLVWVADLGRARRLASRAGVPVDATGYLESTLVACVDTALAAQNAVVAAESLDLGCVYVGAVRNDPEAVAAELGLPPSCVAVFGLAVGVPDPDEDAGVKPRLPQAAVWHQETYDAGRADACLVEYDEHLSQYNRRHGLSGGWTGRVLTRLAGVQSMAGRHVLRETLTRMGLPSR